MFQTFYPLVAREELPEDEMPIEFMQDRRLEFINYNRLKPLAVSVNFNFKPIPSRHTPTHCTTIINS